MLQFRRITAQNRFISQIDGLRFVAIAWVVLFHVYAALSTRSAIPLPLRRSGPPRGGREFFYLHNLIFGAFEKSVNGGAWSLEVEIQFYLLVPLLAGLFAIGGARLRRVVIAALMLASGIASLPL